MRPLKRRPLKAEDDNLLMLKVTTEHSEEAFTELHSRYNWRLMVYITKKGHAATNDVDDIAQLTWLRLFDKSLELYDPSRNAFRAWLFHIAATTAHNYYRKQQADKRGGGIEHHPFHEIPAEFNVPFSESVERLHAAECVELVRKAVNQLTPSQRAIATLFYLRDFSQLDVAALLGLSQQTVSKTLTRTRKNLQELLVKIKP